MLTFSNVSWYRKKRDPCFDILHGTTASHHGDQEAGKEDHEEDHDLRSLADFHGAKASWRLNRRPSMPPLQLLKVYPFHNATVSALDRCGGPIRHRVIWSFFLLLIVVSFLLLCLAFSSSHFSHACSPDGYSNHQDFWRALPLSCTVPMLFEMNSTSVRIWESGCESLLLKSFLRCLAHQASTLFFSHRFSLHFRNTSA